MGRFCPGTREQRQSRRPQSSRVIKSRGDLQPVSPGRTVPNLIMDEQKSFLVGRSCRSSNWTLPPASMRRFGPGRKESPFFRRGLLSIRKIFHSYVPCSRTDAGHRSYGGNIRVRGIIARKPISLTRDSEDDALRAIGAEVVVAGDSPVPGTLCVGD